MKNLITTFILFIVSTYVFAQTPKKAETVSVNGNNIYYEVHGKGKPLFLLHGYFMSSKSWTAYVEGFSKDYEVYLVDLTGHGRSDAFKEKLSIKSVADNLNSLIQYLKLDKIKAIGFSYGGDVLFQLSLLNPSLIESMVTIGALGTWDVNDYPEWLKLLTFENLEEFSWIRSYQTSDDQIKALFEQFGNYTVALSDEQLKSIQTEVLLILGDDDAGMPIEEAARVRGYLPNSDLWILPNVSHGAHEGKNKAQFLKISKAFLSKKAILND